MPPAELSAIQPRTPAATAGGDAVGTQSESAGTDLAEQRSASSKKTSARRSVQSGLLLAIFSGLLAWVAPMLWTVDPTSDSKARAIAGFGVLLLEVFAFQGGLMLLVLAILAAAMGFRKNAAVLTILAAIHAGPGLVSSISGAQSLPAASEPDAQAITILSHNLLFSSANLDALAVIVDTEKPDVIMLQEVVGVRAHEIIERFQDEYSYHIRPTRNSWGA